MDSLTKLINLTQSLLKDKREANEKLILMASMLGRIKKAYPYVFSECIDQSEITELIEWAQKK